MLKKLVNHENVQIRALACDLIGTCAQNNPHCQETLLSSQFLPITLSKLKKDEDEVKIKALFAVSCEYFYFNWFISNWIEIFVSPGLTRDYLPGQDVLIALRGLDILIEALANTSTEKLQIKICFFCSSICNNPKIKREYIIDLYLV